MRELTAELLGGPACALGEGPGWDAGRGELSWIDIPAGELHLGTFEAGALTHTTTIKVGRSVGAVVPRAGGGWLAAAGPGFTAIDRDGTVTALAEVGSAVPGTRMNDAKCDPAGRFWAGSTHEREAAAGSLYRVDLDGKVTSFRSGIGVSNGIGWSPDGTLMYYVDSPICSFEVYDYDVATGTPSNPRQVTKLDGPPPVPDGLTVDDEGCIWVAFWDGGQVRRYTPSGEVDMVVNVPVARTTCCTFGGPGGGTLFITTAQTHGRDEPYAGQVFACEPGVSGPQTVAFAGELPR
ncbi:SMP-30/gluconolactonase/LRE family protein [Amycolatopsis sp. NPDC059657]|uniref:SMP-30/gluconolactonase/LRE family protein n=1 Tax=Amycolatopsis sp. NPDC059657 TaxID=3346899 RepID=UPI00366B2245